LAVYGPALVVFNEKLVILSLGKYTRHYVLLR